MGTGQAYISETISKLRPRPLSGKNFVRLLGIPHTKPRTKSEVSSSSSFADMFDRMPKVVGVT